MNLPISCRARAYASMALLMIIMGFLSSSGWAQEKKVKVETSVTASEVEPGDEFTLRITVHGHSEIVNQALPLDMLFVVDLSSPLDEAKMRAIQGAVLRLIQLAERDGGRMAPGSIRIGLISLSSQAEIAAAPSNDFETLKASAEEIPLPVPGEPRAVSWKR